MYKASRVFAAAAQHNMRMYHSTFPGVTTSLSFQHQPQVRRFSAYLLSLSKPAALPSVAFFTATRRQHTSAADPATASASASASATTSTVGDGEPGDKGGVHVDPRRLPSTIPGITQEELAARITAYHTKKVQEANELSAKSLTQEVELMRRSLSPNDFEEYMANLEKDMAAAAKEQAKLAAMSPLELHQYQQKKKRQAMRYEWYKTFLMVVALVGSTAFLFSLFVFFE